ncbi:MAG TPA: FkbM family methyltransferase, partial [Verrucomicrobiae bacterium]|nr:FkbM family methyltransferase [Verrucomicrobiae bacterium]
VAARCYSTWRSLAVYRGVFPLRDACQKLHHVLQPNRFTEREMQRFITNELDVRALEDNVHEIHVRRNGLVFYWLGPITGGLASGVLQELDSGFPHFYTTPPVKLNSSSLVLDVGACDGLFALRVTKANEAERVICFEPSERTARYLRRAAERNGVSEKILIETCAVGKDSRDVFFTNLEIPEANHVVLENRQGASRIRQISLDDYCSEKGLSLRPTDLIKIDAEGADVDIIEGAKRLIRDGSPQIAVTTYHHPDHAARLIEFLRSIQPRYNLRLKGLTLWETKSVPRPVLLQAALR